MDGGRGEPAARDRANLVAVRRARQELRRHDAAPRRTAEGGGRPDRLPHLHGTPRRSARRPRGRSPYGHRARRRRRRVLLVRVRTRDLPPRRAGRGGRAVHDRRVPAPGAAPEVQRAAQRTARRARAAGLAGRARGLPDGPGGGSVRILVTGAAGFIGSAYVHHVLGRGGDEVVVLDKLTYAGRRENLQEVEDRIEFVEGAIEDRELVDGVMDGIDAVVNFAAESHVDRSIADQDAFARTHVIGTSVLLDA